MLVFANGPGDWVSIPGWVISMVLEASLLNTQPYKVNTKGKRSDLEKEVEPFSTPQCNSNWKGSLGSPWQRSANLLNWYIYIYIYIDSWFSGRHISLFVFFVRLWDGKSDEDKVCLVIVRNLWGYGTGTCIAEILSL